MNWDQIESQWLNMKGNFRQTWGKLTDDDLEFIGGKKDQLLSKLQSRYDLAKADAEKQIDQFINRLDKKIE